MSMVYSFSRISYSSIFVCRREYALTTVSNIALHCIYVRVSRKMLREKNARRGKKCMRKGELSHTGALFVVCHMAPIFFLATPVRLSSHTTKVVAAAHVCVHVRVYSCTWSP